MDREGILRWARQEYGAEPAYLWARYPSYAVLRQEGSGKWFAVVMHVPKHKLGLEGVACVDILNVKCDPLLVGALRQQPGILPAYHMSKSSWNSILLDGAVPDEDIKSLIDLSFQLTRQTAPGKQKNGKHGPVSRKNGTA